MNQRVSIGRWTITGGRQREYMSPGQRIFQQELLPPQQYTFDQHEADFVDLPAYPELSSVVNGLLINEHINKQQATAMIRHLVRKPSLFTLVSIPDERLIAQVITGGTHTIAGEISAKMGLYLPISMLNLESLEALQIEDMLLSHLNRGSVFIDFNRIIVATDESGELLKTLSSASSKEKPTSPLTKHAGQLRTTLDLTPHLKEGVISLSDYATSLTQRSYASPTEFLTEIPPRLRRLR